MRITVKDSERNIKLAFPTGLLLNRLTALLAPKILSKHGVRLSRRQMLKFIKALNRFRRRNRKWKLVEVKSADGEHIEITL